MKNNDSNEKTLLLYLTTVPITLFMFGQGQLQFMKKKGFDVMAVSSGEKHLELLSQREGVRTFSVRMLRRFHPLHDIVSLIKLILLFWELKPALINASTAKAGTLGIFAAWMTRVPVKIYTLRGLMCEIADSKLGWIFQFIEKINCLFADSVIANSQSVADFMINNSLCDAQKIVVIASGSSNGVDAMNKFNPKLFGESLVAQTRNCVGVPPDSVVIGFIGRLVNDKGIVQLIEAWELITSILSNQGIFLLVIGKMEEADQADAYVMQYLLANPRLRYIEWIEPEEIAQFYSIMDIFVLPTLREGFPNVLLEASAMALPVVATRVTGCVDAVKEGLNGTLISPRDSNALAHAIIRYIEDPELRKCHGAAGRKLVLEHYRPEQIWNGLYDEYTKQLLSKGIYSVDSSGSG